MIKLKTVHPESGMGEELSENKFLKSDLKLIVGHVTPYIPFVGLISGGLTVGKHVINNKCSGGSCGDQPSSPVC